MTAIRFNEVSMRKSALTLLILVLSLSVPAGTAVTGHGGAAPMRQSQLPAVPKEAEDAYVRGYELCTELAARPDKAAGSGEWETAIKRLMEAQALAPASPRILQALGLAHQYRGRCLAAVAWLQAASKAIEKTNPGHPQIEENAKRIKVLTETPQNQIEMALDFAKGEIPKLHVHRLPSSGVKDVWPPYAAPPVGPMVVQLANGQWVQNPDLFNKDGSAKLLDVPDREIEMFLIELRLGLGDPSAVGEAEDLWAKFTGSNADRVHISAAKADVQAYVESKAWSDVDRLSREAAEWCDGHASLAGRDGVSYFRDLAQKAVRNAAAESSGALDRWLALAIELSWADEELQFQPNIEHAREVADRGGVVLEIIANTIRPIGRNLLRLRSIDD
jgi:hypothetical protein